MRIASVSFGYPDEEYRVRVIFTHEQALALKSLGVEVDVFDLEANKQLFSEFTEDNFEGINVYRFPRPSMKNVGLVSKQKSIIKRIVSEKKYDLILFSFLTASYLPYLEAFSAAGSKMALTSHGVDAMAHWDKNWLKKKLKKRLLNGMNYIFPVSDYTSFLIKTIIDYKDYNKIIENYNGINKAKFKNVIDMDKDALKKELNIHKDKVILTVCDLIPRKGVDINIKADKILKEQGVDFCHIIIGKGPEKDKLEQMVKEYGLYDNILFIEYVKKDEDLVKYYKLCDIYTMISKTIYNPLGVEGFGISYTEAQYLGKPVVGGNSGGVPTAVKHGFTGFLVDPDKPRAEEKIAFYIEKLLSDSSFYNEISKNAKRFVEENFDWVKNANNIIDTIK